MKQRARLAINDDVGGVGFVCGTGIIRRAGFTANINVPVSPRDTRTPTCVRFGPNVSCVGEMRGDRHNVFSK